MGVGTRHLLTFYPFSVLALITTQLKAGGCGPRSTEILDALSVQPSPLVLRPAFLTVFVLLNSHIFCLIFIVVVVSGKRVNLVCYFNFVQK